MKSGAVDHMPLVHLLAAGGCIAPEEEAAELVRATADGSRPLDELVARRLSGEPLAWITGFVRFCRLRVHVDPGGTCRGLTRNRSRAEPRRCCHRPGSASTFAPGAAR